MARVLGTIGALLACLALSACFVSKSPLIPAERAVNLMPDKGIAAFEVVGQSPNDKQSNDFAFQWVGPHYALTGPDPKDPGTTAHWTFADVGQGYFMLQYWKGADDMGPLEYHLVRRGSDANLDVMLLSCNQLSDEDRAALNLTVTMIAHESRCYLASFAQAERAMKAAIRTLSGPNAQPTLNAAVTMKSID